MSTIFFRWYSSVDLVQMVERQENNFLQQCKIVFKLINPKIIHEEIYFPPKLEECKYSKIIKYM